MGLISKIEDKLSSNKSSSTEPPTYDSSTTSGASKLQNPISSQESSGPTGTAVSGISRDGYGTSNTPSGHTSSTMSPTSHTSSTMNPSSHTTQTTSGVNPNTTTSTNTTMTSSGDRQYYDPYSRKGQQTAHSAAVNQGMAPSMPGTTREDPNISRGHQGGVLNSSQGYSSSAQQQPGVPSTMNSQPQQTTSSHHYGRDAGIVGGAGAAGVGAYEMGKHSGPTTSSSHYPPGTATSSVQPGHTGTQPGSGEFGSSSAASAAAGSTSMSQSQKMASVYEAGYRDGMEHAKAEMMSKLNES